MVTGIATRPLGAVTQLGELGDDLVEGRIDEAVELDLADGTVAPHGQTDGSPDDAGLRQRGVDDTTVAEVALQPFSHSEDAAERADVLAQQNDFGIALHRLAQAGVQRLCQGQRGRRHYASSSKVAR
jgi:hypothetical protein